MPRFCSLFLFLGRFYGCLYAIFYRISTKMNSPGHHVPNGWGHDAQGLGNQCPKGGHTMPKAWATFIPWFVRDIR